MRPLNSASARFPVPQLPLRRFNEVAARPGGAVVELSSQDEVIALLRPIAQAKAKANANGGGSIAGHPDVIRATSIRFTYQVDPMWLGNAAKLLERLRSLNVSGTQASDEHLAELVKCIEAAGTRDLRTLEMCECLLTDAGMRHLTGLHQLAELNLSGNRSVTQLGLTFAPPSLVSLRIPLTGVESLDAMGRRPALTHLEISGDQLLGSHNMLWTFPNLRELEVVDVGGPPGRGQAEYADRVHNILTALRKLPKLESLRLADAFFGDSLELRYFRNLKAVEFFRCRWNDGGRLYVAAPLASVRFEGCPPQGTIALQRPGHGAQTLDPSVNGAVALEAPAAGGEAEQAATASGSGAQPRAPASLEDRLLAMYARFQEANEPAMSSPNDFYSMLLAPARQPAFEPPPLPLPRLDPDVAIVQATQLKRYMSEGQLQSLQDLTIHGNHFGTNDIALDARLLPSLRKLKVDGGYLGDGARLDFSGPIEEIHLSYCQVIIDLRQLARYDTLRVLTLDCCEFVTEEQVAALRASMPNVTIHFEARRPDIFDSIR